MEDRWFDEELAGRRLGDGRLDRRLRQPVEQMAAGFGESIRPACQDWAGTKQAYFGRTVTITRNCAGTMSSRSVRSRPIRTISPQPQGQSVLSGSIICSIRGRCSGKWPRLRAGRGRFGERAAAGSSGAAAASTSADAPSSSSKASWRWSADSFSDLLPYRSRISSRFRCSRRRMRSDCASFSARSVSSAASACLAAAACSGVSVSRSIVCGAGWAPGFQLDGDLKFQGSSRSRRSLG